MKLKASYTVEAAMIITYSMLVIGAAIGLSYVVFADCIMSVQKTDTGFDAVKTFRGSETLEAFYKEMISVN